MQDSPDWLRTLTLLVHCKHDRVDRAESFESCRDCGALHYLHAPPGHWVLPALLLRLRFPNDS